MYRLVYDKEIREYHIHKRCFFAWVKCCNLSKASYLYRNNIFSRHEDISKILNGENILDVRNNESERFYDLLSGRAPSEIFFYKNGDDFFEKHLEDFI